MKKTNKKNSTATLKATFVIFIATLLVSFLLTALVVKIALSLIAYAGITIHFSWSLAFNCWLVSILVKTIFSKITKKEKDKKF